MKAKDSDAMLEVWQMKEDAYNMIKHLSPNDQMKKIAEISSIIINENKWQDKVYLAKNKRSEV